MGFTSVRDLCEKYPEHMNMFDPRSLWRCLAWWSGWDLSGCKNSVCLHGYWFFRTVCGMLSFPQLSHLALWDIGESLAFGEKGFLATVEAGAAIGCCAISAVMFFRGFDPESLERECQREGGQPLAIYNPLPVLSHCLFLTTFWSLIGGGLELPLEGLLCHKQQL